jgi:hypothetical protein
MKISKEFLVLVKNERVICACALWLIEDAKKSE